MPALKGSALLAFVDQRKGAPRDEVIKGAGYVSIRKGKESLKRTRFFEALAAANGHQLGDPAPAAGERTPSFRLKVGPRGLIPVSNAYSRLISATPGSYVSVIIENGAIVLEPCEAPEGAMQDEDGDEDDMDDAAACAPPLGSPPQPTVA